MYQNRIDSVENLITKKNSEINRLKSTANGYKSAYEKTKKEIVSHFELAQRIC